MPEQQPVRDQKRKPQEIPVRVSEEVDSRDLLKGARELRIRHGAEVYRLCHTRNDKLILTK